MVYTWILKYVPVRNNHPGHTHATILHRYMDPLGQGSGNRLELPPACYRGLHSWSEVLRIYDKKRKL